MICLFKNNAWLFILIYLMGSVNFSILLFSALGRQDPRKVFSGNAGAFNIYRQTGIAWASVVLLSDLLRAMGAAWISVLALPMELGPWGGLFLILGNRFPCFHGFKGGKGVANYLGFTLILTPVSAICSAVVWCIVYGFFKIPFIASFAMVLILGIGTIVSSDLHLIHASGVIATVILILVAHSTNIREFQMARKRGA